jgi:hypothetical protein
MIIRFPIIARRPRKVGTTDSPLAWWRSVATKNLQADQICQLRAIITPISIIGEKGWTAAANGDGVAAVGIWRSHVAKADQRAPIIDLVMSAILLAAAEGCFACAMILARERLRHAGDVVSRQRAKTGEWKYMHSWPEKRPPDRPRRRADRERLPATNFGVRGGRYAKLISGIALIEARRGRTNSAYSTRTGGDVPHEENS